MLHRVLSIMLMSAMAFPACAPPKALRDFFSSRSVESRSQSEEFPAPSPPAKPSKFQLGIITPTNAAGWSDLLERGQETGGALVLATLPGGAAELLGIKAGDVIVAINDVDIHNHEQVLVEFRSSSREQHRIQVLDPSGELRELSAKRGPPIQTDLVEHLREITANDPSTFNKFILAQQITDPEISIGLAREVIAEVPGFSEAHALLASRLADQILDSEVVTGSTADEARASVDKAKSLDPTSLDIRKTSARINLQLGRLDQAESDAAYAVRLDDLSAKARHMLGSSRLMSDRPAEALPDLHRAVALDPYSKDYYTTLAKCYEQLGRSSDADATLLAAKDL
ncbi:MAG TPA: tetratricopeptide repeat protein [Actinomycetota bacterium]|nr:tetratricopeptide repeat protein [Actinomycetota bacterium]